MTFEAHSGSVAHGKPHTTTMASGKHHTKAKITALVLSNKAKSHHRDARTSLSGHEIAKYPHPANGLIPRLSLARTSIDQTVMFQRVAALMLFELKAINFRWPLLPRPRRRLTTCKAPAVIEACANFSHGECWPSRMLLL